MASTPMSLALMRRSVPLLGSQRSCRGDAAASCAIRIPVARSSPPAPLEGQEEIDSADREGTGGESPCRSWAEPAQEFLGSNPRGLGCPSDVPPIRDLSLKCPSAADTGEHKRE